MAPLRICFIKHTVGANPLLLQFMDTIVYTENTLFSSFSVISDLALAPAVDVLYIVIAGTLFSAWITAFFVSIHRQMPRSIYISN